TARARECLAVSAGHLLLNPCPAQAQAQAQAPRLPDRESTGSGWFQTATGARRHPGSKLQPMARDLHLPARPEAGIASPDKAHWQAADPAVFHASKTTPDIAQGRARVRPSRTRSGTTRWRTLCPPNC